METKIVSKDQIKNLPIHYYLVGKIWCLHSNKNTKINRDISNLELTNKPKMSLKIIKNNCDKCHKSTNDLCQQCNQMFCGECFDEVHLENYTLSQHKLRPLNCSNFNSSQDFICQKHSQSIDFDCYTCQLQVCSICAAEDHVQHNIVILDKSDCSNIIECTKKGNTFLQNVVHCRDELNAKIQNYKNIQSKKKNNNFDINRQTVANFVASVVGALQFTEQMMYNSINHAESAIPDSLKNIIFQLNCFINDLQYKLNSVEQLMKFNQHSSSMMTDAISDIERLLQTTFYIAKKNKDEWSMLCDFGIFNAVQNCIIPKFNISDTYILGFSPEIPPDYILTSVIDVNTNIPPSRESYLASSISSLSISAASSCTSIPSIDQSISKLSNFSNENNHDLFVKEVLKDQVEAVIVTHVNSPSDFYLQLIANKHILQIMNHELCKFIQTKCCVVDQIEMNNVKYAVQMSCNKWYRGVVVHIEKKQDKLEYTVHFIDYGFTSTVTADRFRNMPENIACLPPLAYNCKLYSLIPSSITGWSHEAYKVFFELIFKEQGIYFMYTIEAQGDCLEVDVVLNNDIYPLSIRDAMFQLGYGFSEQYTNPVLREKLLKTITLAEPIQLEEGKQYNVVLTHFISPHHFYLQINDEEHINLLKQIMDELELKYRPTEKDTHKDYLLYSPSIDMAVAAKYSIDSVWYRAKIINLPQRRMVTVFYIDYGNSETLPWDQLRVLDKKFVTIPPLTIKSSLAEIIPIEDGIECTKWSENASIAMIDLLKSAKDSDIKLTAYVHQVDDDLHKVVLFNNNNRGEFCVNRKLITLGHATTMDITTVLFKTSNRNFSQNTSLKINSKNNDHTFLPSEDTLAFLKQLSENTNKDHEWQPTNQKNSVPGIEMTVYKIISPDDITLKYNNHCITKLIKRMNSMYSTKKGLKKQDWKINDLCAVFIKQFGNWYRGNIVKLDTKKQTASVHLYDLDQIDDEIPLSILYILDTSFVDEKCGFLHCCMSNLIPLGDFDGKWPKYSCDRLIEMLKKYSTVYFAKKGKKNGKAIGEIWVEHIETPSALKPLCKQWININHLLVDQGLALSEKQYQQDSDECSTLKSEQEFNSSFEILEHNKSVTCWLPPVPLDVNNFIATPTHVDMQCNVYMQILNNENKQLLQDVIDELNYAFHDSEPEPENINWTVGQMVIVQYHLDKKWYRGTITKMENKTFTVEFIDFGNTEICTHNDLRSTLYMTDIPQLCVKGFFCSILPLTRNKEWPIPTLDFLHSLIVDHQWSVTIDLNLSCDDIYGIKLMKNDSIPDVCQYMVCKQLIYFDYMGSLHSNMCDYIEINSPKTFNVLNCEDDCNEINENIFDKSSNNNSTAKVTRVENVQYLESCDNTKITEIESSNETYRVGCTQNISCTDIYDDEEIFYNNLPSSQPCVHEFGSNDERNSLNNTKHSKIVNPDHYNSKESIVSVNCDRVLSFSRTSFKFNEVIEGSLCEVTAPTQMTLLIEKISGVNLSIPNKEMHSNIMSMQCSKLPKLDKILMGTLVVVLHNHLWKRGIVVNDGNSVFLVDFGQSIELVEKNVRLCPEEFLELPTFSINCQLARVTKNYLANAENVMMKMTETLRGVNLRIVGIENLDADVIGVELYNDQQEIAYQSLIDSKLLIPK